MLPHSNPEENKHVVFQCAPEENQLLHLKTGYFTGRFTWNSDHPSYDKTCLAETQSVFDLHGFPPFPTISHHFPHTFSYLINLIINNYELFEIAQSYTVQSPGRGFTRQRPDVLRRSGSQPCCPQCSPAIPALSRQCTRLVMTAMMKEKKKPHLVF